MSSATDKTLQFVDGDLDVRRNGHVEPHGYCDHCLQFFKNATCLRFTHDELERRVIGAPLMPQIVRHFPRFEQIRAGKLTHCHLCSILVEHVDVSS